ncbi:MAG: type VI secretion system Vgr family protein [Pseudomonas sp.]
MNMPMPTFFDHSRHTLRISGLDAHLDVLAFVGEEHLSRPYLYRIEFTCTERDLAVADVLNRWGYFNLYAVPPPPTPRGFTAPVIKPLRSFHGVISGFKRLSGSNDEARYEITLQPRFARLGRGKQFRIYQQQSVPEIVEHILRTRHDFRGEEFYFNLVRQYPRREQVMQYDESDLAFVDRLLAEVGIWYRVTSDDRLNIDVVEFHDDQRHYQRGVTLPCRPPSGLSADGQDAVWNLQTAHRMVEKTINFRAYHHREAHAFLDGEVDHTRGAKGTYGEAYHYGEPYTVLGERYALDEDLQSESGFFYARLRHELYLNDQTRLSGTTSSAILAPAQRLDITGGAPKAFEPGAVIVSLRTEAARDRSFVAHFQAIPYSETVCFRPALLPKPRMSGTIPARVSHPVVNPPYADLDFEGRYKVRFLFDRDTWQPGRESAWLRLARPYGGDTHGLHFPLQAGTEVAIAFEQGDPDRPYIAHALHDDRHPDPVTARNERRNVLRTPTNNKLRLDDTRGQEHIKLSTEHSGKSQLNLGHLVDAKRQKRGEGFELRTDGWGAIRGGRGVFISADEQVKAKGEQLDMTAAIEQLESALSLARSLAEAARSAQATPSDIDSQQRLNQALNGLKQPGVLLHAPSGIGMVSPEAVCLASGAESVGIIAAHNADIGAGHNITATAQGGISVVAKEAGLQLKAAEGKVELHAQGNDLHALAKTNVKIESVQGRVEINAPQELVLNCGGAYIRLKNGDIELGAPGNIYLKATHVEKTQGASLNTPASPLPAGYAAGYTLKDDAQAAMPFARYRVTTQQGDVFNGVTDRDGRTMSVNTLVPGDLRVELPEAVYDEQLRLIGPNGDLASNLRYSVTLVDGSTVEGVTDEQGYTGRLVTEKPIQVTQLKLFPPEKMESFCCAALNAQTSLDIDLRPLDVSTNDTNVGTSTRNIPLPEGKKRALTAGEIAMAKTVFKDAINYTKVKVHHGGWWLFLGFQNTAVTPNGEMYYPQSTTFYRDDFSATGNGRDKALFMHEVTHVWQYQLGFPVKKSGMTVTSRGAAAYEYTLYNDSTFAEYNMEQQGEIVSDYYLICVEREPNSVWNHNNRTKDPSLLALVLKDLMINPSNKRHLPS